MVGWPSGVETLWVAVGPVYTSVVVEDVDAAYVFGAANAAVEADDGG